MHKVDHNSDKHDEKTVYLEDKENNETSDKRGHAKLKQQYFVRTPQGTLEESTEELAP